MEPEVEQPNKPNNTGTALELIGTTMASAAITVIWSWPVALLALGVVALATGILLDRKQTG